MDRFFKGQVIYRIAFWLIILSFVLTAHPGMASAKRAQQSLDRSGSVTISEKTADAVVISERHFTVTKSTTIIDLRGKKIQLSDLAVPCDAWIEYRLRMDEDPLALKITVKKLLPQPDRGRP